MSAQHTRHHIPRLDALLARLHGVKPAGTNKWRARCPAHHDRVPSLNIALKNDRILLHCHAGCSIHSVLGALGMHMRELFTEDDPSRRRRPEPSAVYNYTDLSGKLLFQVVRFKPKSFRQRRPDQKGKWIWNLDGVQKVPYKLERVVQASSAGERVYIVEGEKDVDALSHCGLTATTNPGGAGNWQKGFARYFRGAHVVIIPDNDEPGRAHAEEVAQNLKEVAKSVKIVELPGLDYKGDVSDWLSAGHTSEELEKLAESAPEWDRVRAPGKPQDAHSSSTCTMEPLTDLGNAERLIKAWGEDVHFDVDAGKWLIWNGKRWEYDVKGRIMRIAGQVIRQLNDLLPSLDRASADALYAHIKKSESLPRLKAMVESAQYLKGVSLRTTDLDSESMLLNCLNGTLDLTTGTLRPHSRNDLITKLAPVEYDPGAQAPRWQKFLEEVFQEDEELIEFVQRMVGYALTGDVREQTAFILTGKGSNGKSTFMETIRGVLGDYTADTPFSTFIERRDSNTADLAALVGKRLVTASEGDGASSLNESLLKTITGGDQVTCRHLYREFFSYAPGYKVFFATNEIPKIRSQNYAMRRRIVLVPFNQRFYDPSEGLYPVRDIRLREKLAGERSGILAWAVRGCLEWLRCGLAVPDSVKSEVDKLFESQDPLGEFLESRCRLGAGLEVEVSELWRAYMDFCEINRIKPAYKNSSWLSRNLAQRDGIETRRSGKKGARTLVGITLADTIDTI
ncbi:MAG: phage/plasmid primase, P4 family [Armatimonadota bacterium]